jgi:hypothetical protein
MKALAFIVILAALTGCAYCPPCDCSTITAACVPF